MTLSDSDENDEYTAEEVRELYEVIDRSKKDSRNAYILAGVILVLSLYLLFSNPFSDTSVSENSIPAVNLEQIALVREMSDQNSFLRDQLAALQNDIRNERANYQSELTSMDLELNILKSEMFTLRQELSESQEINNQIQSNKSTETVEKEIAELTSQIEEKNTENESLATELSSIRSEVNELLNDTTGAISENLNNKINSLREIIESNTDQSIALVQETQVPLLSDNQILFRNRLLSFIPILDEVHKEVLQVEMNARNEIGTISTSMLNTFRDNTGYMLNVPDDELSPIQRLAYQENQPDYRESLKDLWNLAQSVETINTLLTYQESQEGSLPLGVDLADIASKFLDLQNRPYETKLFLATVTTFINQIGGRALSRQEPTYPERATQREITGTVSIEFAITPLGTVNEETIEIISENVLLADAALTALKQTSYAVNPIPDYIRQDLSSEVLQKIKLFGFTQNYRFSLEN